MKLLSLAGALLLCASFANADGVTVTIDTTSLTIAEGDSFTVDSTVTNNSGSSIPLVGGGAGLGYLSGDQTDSPNDFNLLVGGCVTSESTNAKEQLTFTFATLDPGSSCVFSQRVTAPSLDVFPEDGDAGVWDLNTHIFYTCDGCGNVEVDSLDKIITVEDQPSPSVPEPSSLLLLSAGLLGFPLIRRFLER